MGPVNVFPGDVGQPGEHSEIGVNRPFRGQVLGEEAKKGTMVGGAQSRKVPLSWGMVGKGSFSGGHIPETVGNIPGATRETTPAEGQLLPGRQNQTVQYPPDAVIHLFYAIYPMPGTDDPKDLLGTETISAGLP